MWLLEKFKLPLELTCIFTGQLCLRELMQSHPLEQGQASYCIWEAQNFLGLQELGGALHIDRLPWWLRW